MLLSRTNITECFGAAEQSDGLQYKASHGGEALPVVILLSDG